MRKNIKNKILYSVIMMFFMLFVACEEHYLKYDTGYCGVYFTNDTLNYSFGIMPVEYKSHTYRIPVSVMGNISKEKRDIGYNILDLTEAEEGVHYTIGDAYVLPDSIIGYIPVTVYRDKLEGTYATGYQTYKLCLQLSANDNFVPTLDSLHQVLVFTFDNAVEQPGWYNDYGEKIWSLEKLGQWHPYKYIKMVEYFHEIEKINPETYYKMVAEYGENLEHIKNGDPENFKTTFDKYIYYPMYLFFSDPANRETIESEFSDFPFDFPNPYAGKK